MKSKKSGGLSFNPLLQKTEPERENTREQVDTPTSIHVDTQAGRKENKQESKPVNTQERIPDMPTSKHSDKQARTQLDTSTSASKFTFYFTEEQLDRLDKVWSELRQKRRETGQQRVSKSQIVRVALDRLLDDFESDPDTIISLLIAKLE